MKKLLALTVALLLAMSAFAALAEINLPEYSVISEDYEAKVIDNSSLLVLSQGSNRAMATPDGTPLTGFDYYNFRSEYGWVIASQAGSDNKLYYGLLSTGAVTVIPMEYNDVNVLNENWAVGVRLEPADESDYDYSAFGTDDVFKISTVDIFYLPDGALVATLTRDHYLRAKAYDRYINVTDRAAQTTTVYDSGFNALAQVGDYYDTSMLDQYTTFNDNGLQGLKDPDGNVIIEPTYYMVDADVRDGYFKVYDGQHYGLCDLSGNLVVPMEYDTISITDSLYVIDGYACARLNDMLYYINVLTGETAETNRNYNSANNRGLAVDERGDGDTYIICSADGVETVLNNVTGVYAYDHGRYYRIANSDSNYGLIDWHGQELVPTEYNWIDMTADARYVATQYTYRDPLKLYVVNDAPEAEPAEGELKDDAPVPDSLDIGGTEADEEPAPEADSVDVAGLLNSAITLLKADPAANSAAAVSLLQNVATQIAGNDTVTGLMNSALTLLNADPAANGASVVTLLESMLPLL